MPQLKKSNYQNEIIRGIMDIMKFEYHNRVKQQTSSYKNIQMETGLNSKKNIIIKSQTQQTMDEKLLDIQKNDPFLDHDMQSCSSDDYPEENYRTHFLDDYGLKCELEKEVEAEKKDEAEKDFTYATLSNFIFKKEF